MVGDEKYAGKEERHVDLCETNEMTSMVDKCTTATSVKLSEPVKLAMHNPKQPWHAARIYDTNPSSESASNDNPEMKPDIQYFTANNQTDRLCLSLANQFTTSAFQELTGSQSSLAGVSAQQAG